MMEQVSVMGNSQTWLGSAPITQPDLNATNGVVHILGGVLSQTSLLNESLVTAAADLGDFGPFTESQARLARLALV